MKMIVVSRLPTSTMNITGFLIWIRGSSFRNESTTACRTIPGPRSKSCARVLPWSCPDVLAGRRRLRCPERLVEREVQLEHVDARPAEKAERRRLGVRLNQFAHALDRHTSGRRDARGLQLRRGRRNMRIQPGAARRDHFGRHLAGRDAFLLR